MDEWIDLALSACPDIEDFELGFVPLGNLDMFVRRAQSDGVRLRRLSISYEDFHPRELQSFLEALTDPNHPLTIHLQDLTLQLRTGPSDDDDSEEEDDEGDGDSDEDDLEDVLEPVLHMLEKNRELTKVVLTFNLSGPDSRTDKEGIEELFEYTDCTPWITTGPLDMASKIALLSVFYGEHAVRSDGVDSNIVAIIFQFTVPSVRRHFQLAIAVNDDQG